MKKTFFLSGLLLAAGLGIYLVFWPFVERRPSPNTPQPPLRISNGKSAPVPKPAPLPVRKEETPLFSSSLTPSQTQAIRERAKGLMDTVLKRSELFKNDFRNLETNLGTTRKWDIFGPLSKNDFPEITNGIQASILSYGIVTANMYPPLYFNSLGDPERKRLFENLIMSEKNPSLAVTVKPQFHFVRLTGRDARLFPKDLIEPVRKIWRDAMVQATLITEQRRYWESALNLAAEKEGVKFPLKEEHAFPALAAFDDKLMQNRRAYLGNLQRLFREHGLLR